MLKWDALVQECAVLHFSASLYDKMIDIKDFSTAIRIISMAGWRCLLGRLPVCSGLRCTSGLYRTLRHIRCSQFMNSYLIPCNTRSIGTVHTSAKARLTSVANQFNIAAKIQPFVHWSIANLPSRFHANTFGSFCTKLLTDRQTDSQTRTKT